MAGVLTDGEAAVLSDLRRLASEPPRPEELAARRAAFEAIKKLRAGMGQSA